jgi:hypothetical protein
MGKPTDDDRRPLTSGALRAQILLAFESLLVMADQAGIDRAEMLIILLQGSPGAGLPGTPVKVH